MSSSKGKDHSSGHTLSLPSIELLPRVRPSPSNSEEEGVPLRIVRGPLLVRNPGVLALPPLLVPLNLYLAGPSSTISMMTKADALRFRGVYGIPNDIWVLTPSLNE